MAKKKLKTEAQKPVADKLTELVKATPERRRQFGDMPAKFTTSTGRIIERLSVVDSLYEHDEISPEGYLSATMYAADYDVGFNTRMTANLSSDVVDSSGSADNFNAKRMDASKRFTGASQSLPSESRHVLSHIVLGDLSMTQYAVQFMGSPVGTKSGGQRAKAVLIKAINRLAKHYGPSTAPSKPRTQGYMATGGRPVIHPFQQEDAA